MADEPRRGGRHAASSRNAGRQLSLSVRAPPARRRSKRWYVSYITMEHGRSSSCLEDWSRNCFVRKARFEECKNLGALNLRGTGFASRDIEVRRLRARGGGVASAAEVNVVGLAGFLLAKTAAAYSRRKPKDWR